MSWSGLSSLFGMTGFGTGMSLRRVLPTALLVTRPFARACSRAGWPPRDPATLEGSVLLLRTMVLAFAVRAAGVRHLSHEHPLSAFSWAWSKVTSRFDHCVDFDVCAYRRAALERSGTLLSGSRAFAERHHIFRKPTRLGCVRAPWLVHLARRCDGHHGHWRLVGSRATAAAEYGAELCREWALATAAAFKQEQPSLAGADFDSLEDKARPRYERLALNEWMAPHPWHVAFRQPARPEHHINLKELRSALKALQLEARTSPCTKQYYVLDSRVDLGCAAKGRSASPVLNAELRASLPDVLAFCHYPGYGYSPTRLNVSDDPTRGRPVRDPRSDGPLSGDSDLGVLHDMLQLPTQPRASSEWALLVWKLLRGTRPDGHFSPRRFQGPSSSCPPREPPPWPTAGPAFSSDEAGDGPLSERWLQEDFDPQEHSPFEVLAWPRMSRVSFMRLPIAERLSQVRAAFRRESRACHPDRHPGVACAPASFRATKDASEALLHPTLGPSLAMRWLPEFLPEDGPSQSLGASMPGAVLLHNALSSVLRSRDRPQSHFWQHRGSQDDAQGPPIGARRSSRMMRLPVPPPCALGLCASWRCGCHPGPRAVRPARGPSRRPRAASSCLRS